MTRSSLRRHAVAVLSSGLALLLTLLLGSVMAASPFVAFLAAVTVSAWFGGLRPGLLATALSAVASTYYLLFVAWPYVPAENHWIMGVRVSTFVLAAVTISVLSELQQAARRRAEAALSVAAAGADALRKAHDELEARVRERTAELAQANEALRLDVAEREQTSEERRQLMFLQAAALERFEAVLCAATEYSIIGTDLNGVITIFNEGAERMLGYRADEVVGKLAPLAIHDPDEVAARAAEMEIAPGFDVLVMAARRGAAETREWTYVRKDGSRLTVSLTVTAMRDGQGEPSGFIGIARDVTERKRAEEERVRLLARERAARAEAASASARFETVNQELVLATARAQEQAEQAEQARERFAFLAEVSTELAILLDYETVAQSLARRAVPFLADVCVVDVVDEDQSIRRLAVAPADSPKAEAFGVLPHCCPPDPQGPHPLMRTLATGQSAIYPEFPDSLLTTIARDTEHLVSLRSIGLSSLMVVPLAAGGRTLGAISFITAESGRRYRPDDLALAEEVARRAAIAVDNARLYHQVQAAVRVRDDILATVSHDLKNPLGAIKMQAQLLKRRADRIGTPEVEPMGEGFARIDVLATTMTAMINEILDVARLQIGQPLTLDLRPTDLVALVRETVAAYQQGAERHRIAVATAVEQLEGVWDATRLERVIGNLLSNAIKYSPGGGDVTVRVAREDGPAGSWAVIDVQDQGLGIPARDLPLVFERFRRSSNVGRIGGTGLGLAAALQIVEQHGGTMAVASQEGVGSTFTVRLPLTAANTTPRPCPAEGEKPHPPAPSPCDGEGEVSLPLPPSSAHGGS